MGNTVKHKEQDLSVGDMITVHYKIKEGEKERIQLFKGILIKIKGNDVANRMITVRKISNIGLGVERILPLSSPFIDKIVLDKKSNFTKAKLYFVRNLSESQMRHKLYRQKAPVKVKVKTAKVKEIKAETVKEKTS